MKNNKKRYGKMTSLICDGLGITKNISTYH